MTISTVSLKKDNTALIITIVLALAGIAAWIYQLVVGMQTTGLGQQIVWGLYIAAFFTAVGTGSGLLVLAGVSEYVPALAGIARARTLALALASFIIGALLIALDVGSPIGLWRVITSFRFSSMMTWDFWLLVVAGVIALIYLLVAKGDRPQKNLALLGIIAGVFVVVAEGWMLSTMAAHPMWGSGLTVVTFLLGAAIAGMSIALVAKTANETLQGWLKLALWLGLALVLVEVLTSLVGGGAEVGLILTGFAAPAFWWQVILGLLVPIVLLVRKTYLWLAGILAVTGVVAEKVWTLVAGQAQPWLALPEGVYFPSWIELIAVIGMVALGVLVFRLLRVIFKPE
jgi:molybdopterin-containing oxidoreductase family membrane subunit